MFQNKEMIWIFLSVFLQTGAQVCLKATLRSGPSFIQMIAMPGVWGFLVLQVLGLGAWIIGLRGIPLGTAFAFLALMYITIPVSGYFFLSESLTPVAMLGYAVIVVGVLLVGFGGVQDLG